mmetsp:Transcript_1035/g.4007  ORF Transcript_1035/g.4007 Transcript_1035/m.4007 type:complete len:274 (-) Transcript_1035:1785-2606(-)
MAPSRRAACRLSPTLSHSRAPSCCSRFWWSCRAPATAARFPARRSTQAAQPRTARRSTARHQCHNAWARSLCACFRSSRKAAQPAHAPAHSQRSRLLAAAAEALRLWRTSTSRARHAPMTARSVASRWWPHARARWKRFMQPSACSSPHASQMRRRLAPPSSRRSSATRAARASRFLARWSMYRPHPRMPMWNMRVRQWRAALSAAARLSTLRETPARQAAMARDSTPRRHCAVAPTRSRRLRRAAGRYWNRQAASDARRRWRFKCTDARSRR